MNFPKVVRMAFGTLLIAAASAAAAGAAHSAPVAGPATVQARGGAQADPPPRVQGCANVAVTSPPQFACGGKVYTAFQLTRLREAAEKEAEAESAVR